MNPTAEVEKLTAGDVVRSLVRKIPKGRAATYGTVGRAAHVWGRPIGGARTVAWILASLRDADQTPWYRVVGAGGVILLRDRRGAIQARRLKSEGVRFVRGVIAPAQLIDEVELLLGSVAQSPVRSRG